MISTSGVECKATEVLTRGSGVGDHLVLLLDICTHSVIGNSSLRAVSASGRIIRANVHTYKSNYKKVVKKIVGQIQDV